MHALVQGLRKVDQRLHDFFGDVTPLDVITVLVIEVIVLFVMLVKVV